jgi:UDP:flavonoid glycosyltransferase YjiC (YdhE family)
MKLLVQCLLLLYSTSGIRSNSDKMSWSQLHPAKKLHIAFVALPISHHFEPVLALAKVLRNRNHIVSICVPKTHEMWVKSYNTDGLLLFTTDFPIEDQLYSYTVPLNQSALLTSAIVSDLDRSYNKAYPWYKWLSEPWEISRFANELSRKGLYDTVSKMLSFYNMYHSPMLNSLLLRYTNDKPDLFVVDRYTFAGLSVAKKLNVPYIINSPGPLSDIDNPSNHVPAPLSGNSIHHQTILGRCLNLIFRLRYRIVTANVYKDINNVHDRHGIPRIETREDIYGKSVVLANTVFGIDDARPMNPLIAVVGSLSTVGDVSSLFSCNTNGNDDKSDNKKTINNSVVLDLSSRVPIPFSSLKSMLNTLNSSKIVDHLICIAPHKEEIFYRFNSLKGRCINKIYEEWCDEVLQPYYRTGETPLSVSTAKLVILSGDSEKVFRTVARGNQPMIILPYYADQLDMAIKLERVGCGIMVNPVSPSDIFTIELQKALHSALHKFTPREKMISSIKWLQGVLHSTGGIEEATNYIETVAIYGTESIIPFKDTLVWYEQYALDIYLIYVIILLLMWFGAKYSSSLMSLLLDNISGAGISNSHSYSSEM